MNLSKNSHASKSLFREILKILLITGCLYAIVLGYGRVWTYLTQISLAEASAICSDFYNEVESRIKLVENYEITDSHKECLPHKNAEGGTYYTVRSVFRLSKSGNDTEERIKANINNLADRYSHGERFRDEDKGYTIWVNNDEGLHGQPDTICLQASMMIFSNGEPYDSSLTKYPRYIEPASWPDEHRAPCSDL